MCRAENFLRQRGGTAKTAAELIALERLVFAGELEEVARVEDVVAQIIE
jgi:hypothetical protein